MGYSAEFLNHRVLIRNKKSPTEQTFGDTTEYEDAGCVWANVTWSKGVKALHEGALDAYDTVLIRMRCNILVRRDSQLVYDGVTYQIQSFHADRQDNTIQITATEIVK